MSETTINEGNEQIKRHFEGDHLTITRLDGTAPEPINIEGTKISACITGPLAFAKKRLEDKQLDPAICRIQYSLLKGTIDLESDPGHPHSHDIIGKLQEHRVLKRLSINTETTFNRKELISLLKFNRRYFNDSEAGMELIQKLNELDVSTNSRLKEQSDDRGNKDYQFQQQVESELPDRIVFCIPIFVGVEPVVVPVDLQFEVLGNMIAFRLESPELEELKESITEDIVEEQISSLEDLGILCVEIF